MRHAHPRFLALVRHPVLLVAPVSSNDVDTQVTAETLQVIVKQFAVFGLLASVARAPPRLWSGPLSPLFEIRLPTMHDERDLRIKEKLRRELGSDICRLLQEPDVVEVMLNPDGRLWVERLGASMMSFGTMPPWQAEALMATIASTLHTSITRESPILEGELPLDGNRFEGLIPPIVAAPCFTIRRKPLSIYSLERYVADGIMSSAQRALICTAVDQHQNIVVCGGTGTGKTTLTNAIIDYMASSWPGERLVIIEDTAEIQCRSENAAILRTADGVDMLRLLKATMRLRPDRILVGEVRGAEALALVKAWNTGHPGGVCTVHANDTHAALVRLESLIAEASLAPMQKIISEAVNVVVSIAKTSAGRRVTDVATVTGYNGTHYVVTSSNPPQPGVVP
jgi:type IV secretion system protein TrbB